MYASKDLTSLDFAARQATAYALTEQQRADLKIVYLGRKKEISGDTSGTHQTQIKEDVAG